MSLSKSIHQSCRCRSTYIGARLVVKAKSKHGTLVLTASKKQHVESKSGNGSVSAKELSVTWRDIVRQAVSIKIGVVINANLSAHWTTSPAIEKGPSSAVSKPGSVELIAELVKLLGKRPWDGGNNKKRG